MSSPAQGEPSVPRPKGFGKMISRMKTVLRRSKGKAVTPAGPAGVVEPAPVAPPPAPEVAKVVEAVVVAPVRPPTPPNATKVPRSQLHEERARKLGAKFGLEIKASEWHSTEGHAIRIDKPIRMRIHRTCHACNTTFGTSKECPKCKHNRCAKCTRYPPRRTEAEKQASRERRAALLKKQAEEAPIVPDYDYVPKKIVLTRPSKTGGQDLVHKKPRQRVRRTCHACGTLFVAKSKKCGSCGHVRCTDCPRDPPKKDKYPLGYPGDEFGPSSVPHFICHECKTLFPPNPPDGTECTKCKHPKCGKCARAKPRKMEPEPDPEIVKSLQVKLGNLKIS